MQSTSVSHYNKLRMPALIGVLAALLMTLISAAYAADADSDSSQPESEQDESLLTLIELMETEIATKTDPVDPDHAPGNVDVLSRNDLLARGAQTVADALSLVAGIDFVSQPGNLLVRGVGGLNSDGSGKIKVLLNGITTNEMFSASTTNALAYPIEQIERLEIIRGPGSAIHGEYAYSGVINVVTRKGDDHAYLRAGSFDNVAGGGSFEVVSESGVSTNFSLSGSQTDGPEVVTGPDVVGTVFMQPSISNAPGPSNEKGDNLSTILQIDAGNFSLTAQYLDTGKGDDFGLGNALPIDEKRIVRTDEWKMLELRHNYEYYSPLKSNLKLGWSEFQRSFDDLKSLPDGFLGLYPNGTQASSEEKQGRLETGAEFTWYGFSNHTVLLGMEYTKLDVKNLFGIANFDTANLLPDSPFPVPLPTPQPYTIGYEDRERTVKTIFLQDEYKPSDKVQITAGARYDDYSDVDSNVSPRIAGVFEINNSHILKAQFGEAFRPPTFIELYNVTGVFKGNENINAETIQTTELGYIYKTEDVVARATAFHSDLEDLIILVQQDLSGSSPFFQEFRNVASATTKGIEFDGEWRINEQFKLDGNISVADTEDGATDGDLVGATDLLGNLGLIYQPNENWLINGQIRHVGDRQRETGDSRSELDGHTTLDVNYSRFNLGTRGLTLRAGVGNLFDEGVLNPATPGAYINDFPRAGRTYSAQISKSF